MVLKDRKIDVTEQELQKKVIKDYGTHYKTLWNTTIVKLAQQYGVPTTIYADWPLFDKELLTQALTEYETSPTAFDVKKYENIKDKDAPTEPLPLAYKEMFEALKLGCKTVYGTLTEEEIKKHLDQGDLIQVTIKLHLLYPGKKQTYHSILVYGYKNESVFFHDPTHGESLTVTFKHLRRSMVGTGVGIVYER